MAVQNRTSADVGKASSRMLLKVNTVNARERTLWRSLDEDSFHLRPAKTEQRIRSIDTGWILQDLALFRRGTPSAIAPQVDAVDERAKHARRHLTRQG